MRRSKLTPKVRKKLVKAIETGNYIKVACAYAGIGHSTYCSWIVRGEREIERINKELDEGGTGKILKTERIYVEFLEAVAIAEAGGENTAVETLKDAFKNDWRSAMSYLERRYPERWGRKIITIGDDKGEAVDFQNLFYKAIEEARSEEQTNEPEPEES